MLLMLTLALPPFSTQWAYLICYQALLLKEGRMGNVGQLPHHSRATSSSHLHQTAGEIQHEAQALHCVCVLLLHSGTQGAKRNRGQQNEIQHSVCTADEIHSQSGVRCLYFSRLKFNIYSTSVCLINLISNMQSRRLRVQVTDVYWKHSSHLHQRFLRKLWRFKGDMAAHVGSDGISETEARTGQSLKAIQIRACLGETACEGACRADWSKGACWSQKRG